MNALTLIATKDGEVQAVTLHDVFTVTLVLKAHLVEATGRVWPSRDYAKSHLRWIADQMDDDGFVLDGPVLERVLPEPALRSIKRIAESPTVIKVQSSTRRMLLGIE